MTWLQQAGRLTGKTLHVGLHCWYLAGMTGSMTVRLSTSKLREIGVTRQAAYKALALLEGQKLLQVERHQGACPIVTLLIEQRQTCPEPIRNVLPFATPV